MKCSQTKLHLCWNLIHERRSTCPSRARTLCMSGLSQCPQVEYSISESLVCVQKDKDLPGQAIESHHIPAPATRPGDPYSLRSWRPNSPNANKLVSPTHSLAPAPTQPSKLQSLPGPVQATSEDDFTNDFLADLLPGLVLGGHSSDPPEVDYPGYPCRSILPCVVCTSQLVCVIKFSQTPHLP